MFPHHHDQHVLTRSQSYQAQLQTAATKNEALDYAIGAADNLMKALRLSSNPDEKRDLKAQFTAIVDAADRIKSTAKWSPPAKPQPAPQRSKSEMIGQWAADVAHTSESTAPVDNASQSDASRAERSSTTLSTERVPSGSRFQAKPSAASNGPANVISTATSPEQAPLPASFVPEASNEKARKRLISATSPSLAGYSHIRRLREPLSTRKRTKKEEIILLKASIVDGSKCPPWDKPPSSTEFVLSNTTEPFM
jgi:calpain-7